MKLAIVSTHPIQYNAPWFKLLAASGKVQVCVFYTWSQAGQGAKYDPDFGRQIEWDIPLLEGYEYRFVDNTAETPGTHHFKGIVNPGLIREISQWQPDALLVFGWSFQSHLRCIRHFHGKVPVLFRGDSTLLDERPGFKTVARRFFLKWVYRHIDYALYTGSNNKDYFRIHGLRETQLVFAPHAIDNQRFETGGTDREGQARIWRRELGIKENDLCLLFAGKLEPKKNPFYLLQLAKKIEDPRLKIVITGNGVLENDLKTASAGDARIVFLDFQNQRKMPVVYRLGDVFILPSTGPGETWGLAINEAMACSRPVMVSKKAGCAIDLVEPGRNGLIFDSGDPGSGIEFISRLLDDRRPLDVMGMASKEIIGEYSFDVLVRSIEGLLQKIAKY